VYNFKGSLPTYGNVRVDACREILPADEPGGAGARYGNHTTFYINGISVTKEEAELIINAIKSQGGELTAADFCPKKVMKILAKMPQISADDG